MSESTKTFKRTGHNVTVSREDLINATIERLMSYDSMSPSERKKVSNPYRAPVYTKVEGGKTVQVPRRIQHLAIVKWDSMKQRSELAGSSTDPRPHKRLTNKTLYSVRDPYVMNKELNNVQGISDIYDYENPFDLDIVSSRKENMMNRRSVGSVDIPDQRYGRGGSQGDLSQDIVDFSRVMEREIQDMPYETEHEAGHITPFEGRYLYKRDMPEHSHAYLDGQLSESRRALKTGPTMYGKYKPIVGDDHEVLAEKNTTETDGVEHYAPVNEHDQGRFERREMPIDYATNECTSCKGNDDGYIYKGQRRPDYQDQSGDEEAEYDEDLDERDYLDSDEDEPVVDVKGHDLDNVENYDNNSSDDTYKCLFFLLLLFVIAFVVYKKKQGENIY